MVAAAERRARLGVRHLLATNARTQDPVVITEGLVALHATDPASVYLSAVARMPVADIKAVEDAQYETLELVRMLGMRRTMFVVTAATAPVVQAAASDAIARQLRRRYAVMLAEAGVAADCDAWLERACAAALATMRELGEATGAQLGRATPLLRTRISLAEGKNWAANVNVTSWVTTVLAAEGLITRGRPLGSWMGNQYRWRLSDPAVVEAARALGQGPAQAELARRWLRAFGPATVADLRWWTGWSVRETSAAVATLDTVEVNLEGIPGISLADDQETMAPPEPWVALLPALDPTPMGWTDRDWYLGPHAALLFDRSGNIGPTVWADGRVIGAWAQRQDGEVAFKLLEAAGAETRRMVEAEAERIREAIGDKRVAPKFRTSLERELAGS
jgi:hypothetical protein